MKPLQSKPSALTAIAAAACLASAAFATPAAYATPAPGTGHQPDPADFSRAASNIHFEDGVVMNYVINTKANVGQTEKAARAAEKLGATIVAAYPELGVVVAQTDRGNFRQSLLSDPKNYFIDSAGATRCEAVDLTADNGVPGIVPPVVDPVAGVDKLEPLQWDKVMIGADKSREISAGSKEVLVAILDTGVDDRNPDVAGRIDVAASASCSTGRLDTSDGAWRTESSSHGTHVAGIIGGADNGTGIVGVAPNVRMSAIRITQFGNMYPENAICGFVQAAKSGASVSNNSYFIDPYGYWCPSDPDEAAAIEAVRRAILWSEGQGVLHIKSAGNSNMDMADPKFDFVKPLPNPDGSPAPLRPAGNECFQLPGGLGNVVSVASLDQKESKSSFSNYGLGYIDVAAPGSSILSSVIAGKGNVEKDWARLSGTSMAAPQVSGVAALIKSTHPELGPVQLKARLLADATAMPCPAAPIGTANCTGDTELNSFYGNGLVNALAAVS